MSLEFRNNGLVRFYVGHGDTLAWLIPAWATMCGAVVSGELTLHGATRLLLVILLVEAGWGTLWGALASTNWAEHIQSWRSWQVTGDVPALPYFREGGPGYRLARRISQFRLWWRSDPDSPLSMAVSTGLAGFAVSLILAVVAGEELLLLTLAALAVMQLAVLFDGGRATSPRGWDTIIRLGLPWLVGHLAFGALSVSSLALAVMFSISLAGAGVERRWWQLVLWVGGQLAAIALLIYLQHPLTVLLLALFLFPQWLLVVWSGAAAAAERQGWARLAWPWLAVGMLLTALAV